MLFSFLYYHTNQYTTVTTSLENKRECLRRAGYAFVFLFDVCTVSLARMVCPSSHHYYAKKEQEDSAILMRRGPGHTTQRAKSILFAFESFDRREQWLLQ